MKKELIIYRITLTILVMFSLSSCKKFIEVEAPSTSVNEGNVYKSDQTAASVLTGIYARLNNDFQSNGLTSISLKGDLSADNMAIVIENINYFNYFKNQLLTSTSSNVAYWNYLYQRIYTCNAAIEGLEASTTLTPIVKQQLLGESNFMRAFFYFYLVNLYGDVPLVLGTDYNTYALMPRNPVKDVYAQITSDLLKAQTLLTEGYMMADAARKYAVAAEERVRPNRACATALLSRAYLYVKDYANAEVQATSLITNANYEILPLANVFKKNSKETIWALQPVVNGRNTDEGLFMTLTAAGPNISVPVYMTTDLEQSFELGDSRKTNWTGSVLASSVRYYYPSKYKVSTLNQAVSEYCIVLRLAEQYLIRAEARAQQDNIAGAVSDLNVLRTRARALPTVSLPNPLPNLSTTLTKNQVLDAIEKERRVELFTEWGHRWLDLKRTGRADAVLSAKKGITWQSTDVLYPLPASEITSNFNLVQNPGYSN